MPEPPKKVGKYDVRGLVGKGAMGVVYSAVDPALGRAVAIKTMSVGESPHEAELRLRFLREARSAGMLQHPNIITVHELFEEDGTAYLVMELLEGASLSSLLRRKKKLSLGEKLSIIDQIAAGLAEAHAHGIVHRDLKPSNVFVSRNGVVKVLDFGVAKVGEGELTKAGTVFGTVEYMAPEQVRGASVSPRADIFSLGVVAYEVLAGRNPFRADTLAASVFKIVSDTPEKLAGVPSEVNDLVFRALEKTETGRFQALSELRQALAEAAKAAAVALSAPSLDETDVVVTKDRGDESLVSAEPRVSQWSHVAAQADQLEELYRQGVAAYNEGRYANCVEKMSQVLDEVPVHSMSLHYLAMSEEHRRRERLGDTERRAAAEVLTAMRDAHRGGDARAVMERANELLRLDKESLEARWYRRHAEARLRAVSVGGSKRTGEASAASRAGTLGRSFGYVPRERRSAFGRPAVETADVPLPPSRDASGGGGRFWVLGGVAVVFVGLVVMWLGSIQTPAPAVAASSKANPVEIPGVKTSPFDELDDDGTVVLQIPRSPAATIEVARTIPTSIPPGRTVTLGIFGEGFTADTVVRVEGDAGSIASSRFVGPEQLEVELEAREGHESLELLISDPAGGSTRAVVEIF